MSNLPCLEMPFVILYLKVLEAMAILWLDFDLV